MSRLKWVSGLAEPCRAGKDRGPFGRKKPLAVPTQGRGSWPSSSSGWLCCSGAHLSRAPDARLEGDGLGSEPCSRCVPGVLTNEGQSQEHILGRTGAPAHPSDSQDWVTALAPPCLSPWAPARLSCQLPSSLDRGAEVSGGQPAAPAPSSPFPLSSDHLRSGSLCVESVHPTDTFHWQDAFGQQRSRALRVVWWRNFPGSTLWHVPK